MFIDYIIWKETEIYWTELNWVKLSSELNWSDKPNSIWLRRCYKNQLKFKKFFLHLWCGIILKKNISVVLFSYITFLFFFSRSLCYGSFVLLHYNCCSYCCFKQSTISCIFLCILLQCLKLLQTDVSVHTTKIHANLYEHVCMC